MHRNVERSFVVGFEPWKAIETKAYQKRRDINVTVQHRFDGQQKDFRDRLDAIVWCHPRGGKKQNCESRVRDLNKNNLDVVFGRIIVQKSNNETLAATAIISKACIRKTVSLFSWNDSTVRTLHRHSRATFSKAMPVSPISALREVEEEDEGGAGAKASDEATKAKASRADENPSFMMEYCGNSIWYRRDESCCVGQTSSIVWGAELLLPIGLEKISKIRSYEKIGGKGTSQIRRQNWGNQFAPIWIKTNVYLILLEFSKTYLSIHFAFGST